jgi:thioredoxin reductase (NADPH)
MSSPLIPGAPEASTPTFPVLTPAQIARIRPLGHLRNVHPGEILFKPDDARVPFFVLLSGAMEVVQPSLEGERPVAHHRPVQFTGEIMMITGQRCLVLGRVKEPGEFLQLDPEPFRKLVAEDAELSEILMRAFILRRLELIKHGYGDIILTGSAIQQRRWNYESFSLATTSRIPTSISIPTGPRRPCSTAST